MKKKTERKRLIAGMDDFEKTGFNRSDEGVFLFSLLFLLKSR